MQFVTFLKWSTGSVADLIRFDGAVGNIFKVSSRAAGTEKKEMAALPLKI